MNKLYSYFSFFLIFMISFLHGQATPPIAVTAGKSIFRTIDSKIYLETANNQRPTMRQSSVVFLSDYMIYDEELKIGYAYGNLRFADPDNNTFLSAEEGTYFVDLNKIVLRKTPEILIEQGQSQSTKIQGNIITIYPDDSYIHVQGNIQIDDGQTFISGKEVKIWSRDDRMLVSGGVESISEEQQLAADTLDVLFADGGLSSYTAQGSVKSVSKKDNFALLSTILTYDHQQKLFRATESPSVYFNDQDTIAYANVVEYYQETNIGNLLGDVVVVQNATNKEDQQKAYSRWALYDGTKETINMYGNPRLEQNDSVLYGLEIVADINSNTIDVLGGGQGFFNRGQ